MPVAFEEFNDSPTFEGSQREMIGTRRGKIQWSDLNSHFTELFPPAILGVPSLPALMPGSTVLFADNVKYKPFGNDPLIPSPATESTCNGYSEAEAHVTYRTIAYQSGSTSIYTIKWAAKAEIFRLPNYGLKWSSDDAPVGEDTLNAGKVMTGIEIHVTLHRVPSIPTSTILGLLGKVNNGAFQGVAAECLLFAGANVSQTVTSDGTQPFEVDLVFASRVIDGSTSLGWNHYFRQSSGNFERLKTKSGNDIFLTGSFSGLL